MRSFLQRLRDDNPDSKEDTFNTSLNDDLIEELGMLLSSRPLCYALEDVNLVSDSVLNYGINATLSNPLTGESGQISNHEISARILVLIKRYEKRFINPIVEHLYSDENYSVYSVTANYFTERININIKYDHHLGEFTLL